MDTNINRPNTPQARQIGSFGTAARVVLGLLLLGDGLVGSQVSLGRDDQIGCLVLSPVDAAEGRLKELQ